MVDKDKSKLKSSHDRGIKIVLFDSSIMNFLGLNVQHFVSKRGGSSSSSEELTG